MSKSRSKKTKEIKIKKLTFPDGFLWGAASSAHQVEGGNKNDWTRWEKENASRLAEEAKTRWEEWQQKKFPEMFEKKNYISGRATDHYNRYKEDFDLAKSMGHNAHRISIEWSRIEPKEGKFSKTEIEHYRMVILAMKERGLEPFVTLWHWTLPEWAVRKGGWASRDMIDYFERYVDKVVSELQADVRFWLTINEPQIYSGQSYLSGDWPPEKKSPLLYLEVVHNLMRGHVAAYKAIKKIDPALEVGWSSHNIYFEAHEGHIVNRILRKPVEWWWNHYLVFSTRHYVDFIGVNSYKHHLIKFGFFKNMKERVSDMGWELYPEALYHTLLDLQRYHKPLYVTESGLADSEDTQREWFLKEVLEHTYRAIEKKVPVKGFLYWSLTDNFEWDKGFWPRFGLIEIDYKTLKRKKRPSAHTYAKICKSNQCELEMHKKMKLKNGVHKESSS